MLEGPFYVIKLKANNASKIIAQLVELERVAAAASTSSTKEDEKSTAPRWTLTEQVCYFSSPLHDTSLAINTQTEAICDFCGRVSIVLY